MTGIEAFIATLQDAGLTPHGRLDLADGALQRFRVSGDKPGSRNGWAIYHGQPVPAGAFGSWKTGEQHRWRAQTPVHETRRECAERRRLIEQMHHQRVAEQQRVHAAARDRVVRLLRVARPANDDHPYLRAKGVHAFGIWLLRNMLMIPAHDATGTVHTAQFIGPDGTKRFLSGGRIEGCYFAIGRPADTIYLAEGYSTGSTVYTATGAAVAVCFAAGNLKPVALALRAKFPLLRLVIAADNDAATPGNPGVKHAFDAAAAAGALVAVPEFEGAL